MEREQDILDELRDWAVVADGVQGKATMLMLSGAVFSAAADEIERLHAECNHLHDAYMEAYAELQIARQQVEQLTAQLWNARTGRALLSLEKERDLADRMAEVLQFMLTSDFWEDSLLTDVLDEHQKLRTPEPSPIVVKDDC